MIQFAFLQLFTALLAASWFYCILGLRAVADYKRRRHQPSPDMPFITVMKPLAGAEEGLRDNLRTFFEQDYPEFEVLMAVETAGDPAARIALEVMAEYPKTHSRLIVSGESSIPNRKVHSLRAMLAEARYDILLMADSDVRTGPDLLRVVSAEMTEPGVELVTCPYRASAGPSLWSATEAIGLNTEFLTQVLVARMLSPRKLQGIDFALGPTLAIQRRALEAIGGFDELAHYLAEDFIIGNRVAKEGGKVVLSAFVVEHRLGTESFWKNFDHRLRWARSTRRSRPRGYVGQVFTNPIPIALLMMALAPQRWPALAVTLVIRAWVAWATSQRVLRDPLTRDFWYLVPFQDLASFAVWIGGFFGSTIQWRGRKLKVLADGRFDFNDSVGVNE